MLLNTTDAANYLNCSESYLNHARISPDRRGPAFVKIGAAVRYDKSDLDSWIDAHILVSEAAYAVGRYVETSSIHWFHANMIHMGAPLPDAAAIEFVTPYEAEIRDLRWNGTGQRLATSDNQNVMQSGLGVTCKPMGVIVGANCLKFGIGQFAVGGPRALSKMRQAVFNQPDKVAKFIGTGEFQ